MVGFHTNKIVKYEQFEITKDVTINLFSLVKLLLWKQLVPIRKIENVLVMVGWMWPGSTCFSLLSPVYMTHCGRYF